MGIEEALDDIFEKASEPTACLVKCSRDITVVLEAANSCSRGMAVVQVFKNDESIVDRLVPSYLCASLRKADGSMRAKSLANEMLLFVAGNMNIRKALAICGASGNEFVVFATSRRLLDRFLLESGSKKLREYRLAISNIAGDVAVADLKD